MRHTSPRRADVKTIKIDDTHQITAWVSHDADRKAYVLTVIPEELRTYPDGAVIRVCRAYSGQRVRLADAPRFSAKRLAELADDLITHAYVDAFAAAYTTSTEA